MLLPLLRPLLRPLLLSPGPQQCQVPTATATVPRPPAVPSPYCHCYCPQAPSSAKFRASLGVVHLHAEQWAEAVDALSRANEKEPMNVQVRQSGSCGVLVGQSGSCGVLMWRAGGAEVAVA